MLVTLATRTFMPEPTAAALRLGALARALAAGGDRVRVLTSRLAPASPATPPLPRTVPPLLPLANALGAARPRVRPWAQETTRAATASSR